MTKGKSKFRFAYLKGQLTDFTYGTLLTGTFEQPLFLVLMEVFLVVGVWWMVEWVLGLVIPSTACERACFHRSPDKCCAFRYGLLIRYALFGVVLIFLSALSTVRKRTRKVQHSAFVAATLLTVLTIKFGLGRTPLFLYFVLLPLTLFCMHAGLKLGLRWGK